MGRVPRPLSCREVQRYPYSTGYNKRSRNVECMGGVGICLRTIPYEEYIYQTLLQSQPQSQARADKAIATVSRHKLAVPSWTGACLLGLFRIPLGGLKTYVILQPVLEDRWGLCWKQGETLF